MHGIIHLDNNFSLPNNFSLTYLDDLPVLKHKYGNGLEKIPLSLYWTEYQLNEGSISFARKINLEYQELARYVVEYLNSITTGLDIIADRVNILKTTGNIPRHVDESLRRCCINIGLRNSDGAITYSSNTTDLSKFDSAKCATICMDGHAYLLDTGSLHEVTSTDSSDNPRFLITYGFNQNFSTIRMHCNNGCC